MFESAEFDNGNEECDEDDGEEDEDADDGADERGGTFSSCILRCETNCDDDDGNEEEDVDEGCLSESEGGRVSFSLGSWRSETSKSDCAASL
mmetsp:Transcript_12366/g.27130  ORF Transcript_12366/g.27130 Transcript_12366/m.27130 type:complete len:92 (-) Transcript_12366:287-562(-)